MLNPFPIQFLSLLAYFLLRLFVGGLLLYFGIRHLHNRDTLRHFFSSSFFPYGLFSVWYLAVIEMVAGAMFIVGFYTQIAALVVMVLSLKMIVFRGRLHAPSIPSRFFYVLLLGASLSLFITGAGAFAFDLPI